MENIKRIFVDVQGDVLNEAEVILDDLGLDVQTAIRMFFKRIVKDGSVAFVLSDAGSSRIPFASKQEKPMSIEPKQEKQKIYRGEMTKSTALRCLGKEGTAWIRP